MGRVKSLDVQFEEGQAGVDFERHEEVDNEPEHLDGSTEGVNK
jgi:hypothetical protein